MDLSRSRYTWAWVPTHTEALRSVAVSDGSVKAGLDGAEEGTCLSRCWTVPLWLPMPARNRRVPPLSTPISHPKMPVLLLNLKLAKLRGSSEHTRTHAHTHMPPRPWGFWTMSPPYLAPLDLLLVSLLWTDKKIP